MAKAICLDIETRYDENRFVDAYHLCRTYFENMNEIAGLDTRSIILLGRLAGRLGSGDLQGRIFGIARDKAPEDPLVCYFAGRSLAANQHLLLHLRDIEKLSVDAFETEADKASWLSSTACVYGSVRDFETAYRQLTDAFSLDAEHAWVYCCQAEVLIMEDRWAEGLVAAEKAWEISPGMPHVSRTIGRILAKTKGVAQAAARLTAISKTTQSYEVLLSAVWYLCAYSERQTGENSIAIATEALTLSDRAESLAPLKDDECASAFAIMRTDIAWLLRNFDSMNAQRSLIEHPFYQSVLSNIESAESSEVTLVHHSPIYQKHNTCLPSSVATVLKRFDRHIDVDELSEELTFGGTAIWRVIDWLVERGYSVKPFIADAKIALALLQNGLPFVLCVKTVSHYHAMAAIGVDHAAGVLLVHDPGNARMEKQLLSKLGKSEIPFGLEALAIVPPEKAKLLEVIPASASEPFSAYQTYLKAIQTSGTNAGRAIIDQLRASYPDHPFLQRMEAIHFGLKGMAAKAIKRQIALLKTYSDCLPVRQELLESLYRTGNTNRIRKVLARLVLKKRMPGISAAQEWQYPPADYVSQFSTYGAMMDVGDTTVEKLLWDAIEREPIHAGCHHALGDVYSMKGKIKESVLPYRCAATLDLENHHYARAYLNAMARSRRIDQGFSFLEQRTEKLGGSLGGGEIWITLIEAYEDYGYPEKAAAFMTKALEQRRKDPYLLSWAVKFWARTGANRQARDCLLIMKRSDHRPLYFSAATAYHRMVGKWQKALAFCKQWLGEEPGNPTALREFLALYEMARGRLKGLALAKKWCTQKRGNDEIELIYIDRLKELYKYDEQLDILRVRIKRNPYDTWAYRELGFLLIRVIDIGQDRDTVAIRTELEKTIEAYRRLAPDDAVLTVLEADWADCQGHSARAAELYKKAVVQDPEYEYAFNRAWQLSGHLPEEDRAVLFKELEQSMFHTTDFLYLSKTLANMAAKCFGSAEAHRIVDRWLERFPKDPEIPKAKVNLLLDYGQGRTDAEKAVTLLLSYIERFPYHSDLKFMLSRAYRILQDDAHWVETSLAIIEQFPLSSNQRRQLSEYFRLKKDVRQAKEILREGIQVSPLDEWLRYDLVALLFQTGDAAEAGKLLEESLLKIPEDIIFRQQMVDLLFENGHEAMAVEVARTGTDIYPDGAVLWKQYGDALWRSSLTSDLSAVEKAYLKSLEFNPRFEDAADRLSELYSYKNRFDLARAVISDQLPHHVQKGELLTRMAWIDRQAGNKTEATDQLVKVVTEWPRERWAWQLLIEWIEADENWTLAKRILRNVHPVMDENPDFVSDKLHILHRAGDVDTRAEWDKLLHDFPEHEKAHCLRFDMLLDAEEFDAAEDVLASIESHSLNSSYLAARRVALKADQQDFDKAVEAAIKLFQIRYDVGGWCRWRAVQSFKDYNQLPRLIGTAIKKWENGAYIEPACFKMVIEHVEAVWDTEIWFSELCRVFGIYPEAVKRLKALLPLAMQRDGQRGSYTAAILSRLDDFNQRKLLIEFAKKFPDIARTRTQIWQIIGFAYVTGSKREREKARQWLTPWRNHDGCELWMVSNLIIAIEGSRRLKPRQRLEQILKEAEDGLRILPPDNLTQFVVSKYCEAALRLGLDEAFLSMALRYNNILRDTDTGYWHKPDEPYLPWAMCQFRSLIQGDPGDVKQLTKYFNDTAKRYIIKNWVYPEWKKRAKQIVKAGPSGGRS